MLSKNKRWAIAAATSLGIEFGLMSLVMPYTVITQRAAAKQFGGNVLPAFLIPLSFVIGFGLFIFLAGYVVDKVSGQQLRKTNLYTGLIVVGSSIFSVPVFFIFGLIVIGAIFQPIFKGAASYVLFPVLFINYFCINLLLYYGVYSSLMPKTFATPQGGDTPSAVPPAGVYMNSPTPAQTIQSQQIANSGQDTLPPRPL